MNEKLMEFLTTLSELPEFGRPVTSVDEKASTGDTPLHIASIQGNLAIVEALVEAGADLNAGGEHAYTPLHEAIEQRHKAVADYLVKRGANLDVATADGTTARQMLAREGWLKNNAVTDCKRNAKRFGK